MSGERTETTCVGETMALLVPDPPTSAATATTFRREIGGAESNVAIHLARAGRRVSWRGVLGTDGFGDHIATRLGSEGVHCVARRDSQRPTGLYLKELSATGTRVRYYRQGSAGATLSPGDADAVWNGTSRLLHTTGITPVLSYSACELVRLLLESRPAGTLVSFDINYRAALHDEKDASTLRSLARKADVVFCGMDEAHVLWGVDHVEEVRNLLPEPDIVVVKQGPAGASAHANGRWWFEPAPEVDVVEPVGAGDAFAAGFLDGLLDTARIDECLTRAAQLAGQALRVDGDIPVRDDTVRAG